MDAPSPFPRPSPRERLLLYSLWALLILPFLLYCFWPRPITKGIPDVSVSLAPELETWFTSGKLVAVDVQGIQLDLQFGQKSLKALEQVHAVHLGYDLGREKEVLYRGTLLWHPDAIAQTASKTVHLVLPNPQSAAPRWIRLYFADSR